MGSFSTAYESFITKINADSHDKKLEKTARIGDSPIADLTELDPEESFSDDSLVSETYSELDEKFDNKTPTKSMEDRHQANLAETIPIIDIADSGENRQFAPEYSQSSYLSMLTEEKELGNYLKYS